MAFDSSDMMKNWQVRMFWKAERTRGQEQHRQQLLVSSKMERQSKLHGNELQSVVSDWGLLHGMVHIGLWALRFGLNKGDWSGIGCFQCSLYTRKKISLSHFWLVAVHMLEPCSNFSGLKCVVNFWLRS